MKLKTKRFICTNYYKKLPDDLGRSLVLEKMWYAWRCSNTSRKQSFSSAATKLELIQNTLARIVKERRLVELIQKALARVVKERRLVELIQNALARVVKERRLVVKP